MNNGIDLLSYTLGKKAGGGSTPTGTIDITQNGITNVSGYATANVQVPEKQLEEKSVTISSNTTTLIEPSTGKDGMSSVSVTTNIPQPSGKITITQNGTDIDVSSYASADVSVGSTINSIKTLNNAYKNILDTYLNSINAIIPNRTAYTNEAITLYTPNETHTKYGIISYPGRFAICWFMSYKGSTNNMNRIGSNGSSSLTTVFQQNVSYPCNRDENDEYYVTGYNTFDINNSTSRYNYYISSYYDTLEEAINAIKSNSTTYTNLSNSYLSYASYIAYSNDIFFVGDDDDIIVKDMGIISHNETIVAIPSGE